MIEANNIILFGKNGSLRLKIPSLKFHSPGITALVGHNGAGKSSLLRLAAGLEKPNLGAVMFNGKDTFLHFEELKSIVHILSWGVELYHSLSAKDHLNLFRSISANWNQELEKELLQDLAIPTQKKLKNCHEVNKSGYACCLVCRECQK